MGGRLCLFINNWKNITSDPFVLHCIQGYKIPFARPVFQYKYPKVVLTSHSEFSNFAKAIENLIEKGAIKTCNFAPDQFLSSYFLVPKPDGSMRFILNLKDLNSFIDTEHFKLEDVRTASNLITKDCFMAVLDLKDAYLSIPIHASSRKYLRFTFDNKIYEFVTLPFGLNTAPFVFTKVMKPILSNLRKLGLLSVAYLDDLLLLGESERTCCKNLKITEKLVTTLGFLINNEKSRKVPSQRVNYLGFTLDSRNLSIELTERRKTEISAAITCFIRKKRPSIEEFASIIGKIVATCQASTYGWLYTKLLEREKTLLLRTHHYNYKSLVTISDEALVDLKWWKDNIGKNYKRLNKITSYHKTIYTDASKTGWGATDGCNKAWGHWNESEISYHINYLELLAIKKALLQLSPNDSNINILLRVDNTTAIAYINKMGGVQYLNLLKLSRSIWRWAESRQIFLFASYIKSKDNTVADSLSRIQNLDTEWALTKATFTQVVQRFGYPEVDLFASYCNAKCEIYVSRYPEQQAFQIDAFTINWKNFFFYAFPPFSIVLKTLRKIEEDGARGIIIVPDWPNQPWYPLFHKMLIQDPLYLQNNNMLSCPFRQTKSAVQTSNLIAGLVCARHLK